MASRYTLQILGPDGRVLHRWAAGDPIELDLTEAIVEAAIAKGIGVFRTEAQVVAAIREAVAVSVYNLKALVRPVRA